MFEPHYFIFPITFFQPKQIFSPQSSTFPAKGGYSNHRVEVNHPCSGQFSVPQIEYSLGGTSKKGSHVYFLLQVFWVILLFDINVVLMLPW